MQILRQFESIAHEGRPVYCAIGMFDGLHQGHQLLLNHITKQAEAESGLAIVLTFQEHPAQILAPAHSPGLIYPQSVKEELLKNSGLDMAWIVPFDKGISTMDATSFIQKIKHHCGNLAGICVGDNFAFGHRRSGDAELLRHLGREWGFHAECKPAVLCDGQVVSSTRIRNLISDGDLTQASRLLGRPYCLAGEIIRGDGLGRQLGYPTANLDCQQLTRPPSGVYAVRASVRERELDGVLNIGTRPTLNHPTPKLQVEAHFWNLEDDIYGDVLSLEIRGRIRDEQRFPDIDALKKQIKCDIQTAKSILIG